MGSDDYSTLQFLNNKFTSCMQEDAARWEANANEQELRELNRVWNLLQKHERNYQLIYLFTIPMSLVAVILYAGSSFTTTLALITVALATILVVQVVTVRIKQLRARSYIQTVSLLIQHKMRCKGQ